MSTDLLRIRKAAIALCALMLLGAAESAAAPVYLTCSYNQSDGEVTRIDFALNEETGQATMTFAHSGKSRTTKGIFTADKVSIVSSPGELGESTFIINRETLIFKRIIPALHTTSVGKCIIATPKPRKF